MKPHRLKRLILAAVIAAAGGLFWALDLDRYLTLAALKGSLEGLRDLYARYPLALLGGYFALYVAVAALSLPGAAVLTLAGGGLFGFVAATLVVSFASSLGATLACLASRFLLRDWVQARLGDRIAPIHEGIAREGAFYLFTLRLIPLFPFWTINLLMGLTRMPLWRFYWVSQVGMFAGTLVYVNAGRELGRIDALEGILTPGLIASLALLGLFPLVARRLVQAYRRRFPAGPRPS